MISAKHHVVWRQKADLLVVLDTESGRYFTLNATAMQLWLAVFERGASLEQDAERMVALYGEGPSRAQVEADCRGMLGEWREAGLVEEKDAAGAGS